MYPRVYNFRFRYISDLVRELKLGPERDKVYSFFFIFRDVSDALVETREVSQIPAVSPTPKPVTEVSIYYVYRFYICRISQGYTETLQRFACFIGGGSEARPVKFVMLIKLL